MAAALREHSVEEARQRRWDTLRNGELLDAADAAGFDVFVTTVRNIPYQQNLAGRQIAFCFRTAASERPTDATAATLKAPLGQAIQSARRPPTGDRTVSPHHLDLRPVVEKQLLQRSWSSPPVDGG